MRAVSCVAACLMFSVGEGYRLAGGRALGRPPVSSRIARAHLARPPLGASTAAAPAGEAGGAPKAELELVEMPFVGLMRDARAKSKYALSDLTDGLNVKCVAASIFMFFACIAPAIAFGGLLERATAGAMGTMEMVAATSACGMLYALGAGQPLTIIGATGPCLAFTTVLYKTCVSMGLPFLPVYAWVGLWSSAILAVCALFSLSNFVEYISRFTDEVFSLLISLIFVVEAVKDISGQLAAPALGTVAKVAAPVGAPLLRGLLSLTLASTTYLTATTLAAMRRGKLLTKRLRNTIANFAPTIGIALSILVGRFFASAHGVAGRTLNVPLQFATTSGRPWLVPIFDVPLKVRLLCAVPAVMASILLFFDQVITVRLVNNAQWRLKKGYGFHLDMAVLSLCTAATSLLGMPWLVAATVRSVNHVKALCDYEPSTKPGAAPGELQISGVSEQRLTAFAIHAMIGLSIIFFRPFLRSVPMAVLTGLFLYLGQSALSGNQMWERTTLLVTDPNMRPDTPYTRGVPFGKVRAFTLLQLVCLGAMVWVKDSKIGVLFPVIVAGLAPVRILIEKLGWFSKKELEALDSE